MRECFFQAVPNSSWAIFDYLGAVEIGGTDTLKELLMLFAAHDIGFMKLDVANRLATESRDFLEYVKLVKQFYQTGEARLADWDVPGMGD